MAVTLKGDIIPPYFWRTVSTVTNRGCVSGKSCNIRTHSRTPLEKYRGGKSIKQCIFRFPENRSVTPCPCRVGGARGDPSSWAQESRPPPAACSLASAVGPGLPGVYNVGQGLSGCAAWEAGLIMHPPSGPRVLTLQTEARQCSRRAPHACSLPSHTCWPWQEGGGAGEQVVWRPKCQTRGQVEVIEEGWGFHVGPRHWLTG